LVIKTIIAKSLDISAGPCRVSLYNTFMETLTGSLERITFYNEENGYSVLRLLAEDYHGPAVNKQGMVTVVGDW